MNNGMNNDTNNGVNAAVAQGHSWAMARVRREADVLRGNLDLTPEGVEAKFAPPLTFVVEGTPRGCRAGDGWVSNEAPRYLGTAPPPPEGGNVERTAWWVWRDALREGISQIYREGALLAGHEEEEFLLIYEPLRVDVVEALRRTELSEFSADRASTLQELEDAHCKAGQLRDAALELPHLSLVERFWPDVTGQIFSLAFYGRVDDPRGYILCGRAAEAREEARRLLAQAEDLLAKVQAISARRVEEIAEAKRRRR